LRISSSKVNLLRQTKTKMITGPFYIYIVQKCFVFVTFVCSYPGRPHVAAATWPCTYL